MLGHVNAFLAFLDLQVRAVLVRYWDVSGVERVDDHVERARRPERPVAAQRPELRVRFLHDALRSPLALAVEPQLLAQRLRPPARELLLATGRNGEEIDELVEEVEFCRVTFDVQVVADQLLVHFHSQTLEVPQVNSLIHELLAAFHAARLRLDTARRIQYTVQYIILLLQK